MTSAQPVGMARRHSGGEPAGGPLGGGLARALARAAHPPVRMPPTSWEGIPDGPSSTVEVGTVPFGPPPGPAGSRAEPPGAAWLPRPLEPAGPVWAGAPAASRPSVSDAAPVSSPSSAPDVSVAVGGSAAASAEIAAQHGPARGTALLDTGGVVPAEAELDREGAELGRAGAELGRADSAAGNTPFDLPDSLAGNARWRGRPSPDRSVAPGRARARRDSPDREEPDSVDPRGRAAANLAGPAASWGPEGQPAGPALGDAGPASTPGVSATSPARRDTSPGVEHAPGRRPTTAPPVVIGRIDIQVSPPEPDVDPFAGLRALESGLTARRGGGW